MAFFEDIYKRLFSTENSEEATSVSVNTVLKRSEHFSKEFEIWKVSGKAEELMESIWQSFYWQKKGVDKQPVLLVLESNHSNGFALSYDDSYGRNGFQFLFDLMADQVKSLGYRPVISRRTIEEKGDVVETREMHYLKPKVSFVEPIDQQYGNIQIEHVLENDQPVRIKFRANTYPDRKYKAAKSFDELAEQVLTSLN